MTGNAAYSFVNVDAVIEISKSGHIVDPYPFDGLARSVTFPHRRKQRTVRPDLGMAIHADFRRRNAGKSRVFYRGVTVSTVDPVVTDVVLVTELNRLRARHTDSSHIGRSVNGSHERQEQYNYGNAAEDADPGNRVCASVKYLGHRPRNSPGVVFSGSGPVINRACRRTSSASIGPTAGSSATQSIRGGVLFSQTLRAFFLQNTADAIPGLLLGCGRSPAAINLQGCGTFIVFVPRKSSLLCGRIFCLLAYTLRISLVFRSLLRLVRGTSTEF